VRVLFDQGTPVPRRNHIPGHHIETANELGWGNLKNGELLQQADVLNFDVLVTTDQNLKYQQNLADRRVAIVVLKSTSWPRIQKVLASVVDAIDKILPNGYVEVEVPHDSQ
jgi:hypothetical protein